MVQHHAPMDNALRLVRGACQLAGPFGFVDDARSQLSRRGILAAVRNHDTPALFDWLMETLSFQGIADRVAKLYLQKHGNATWPEIDHALRQSPSCMKLGGYWLFNDCRYEKGSGLCSEPGHIGQCPLPRHTLRNGRLNQTAYSLFLFIRDVAGNDLIQWIDDQLEQSAVLQVEGSDRLAAMRSALIDPFRGVYGISDKVISMALSSLLLAAGRRRPHWLDLGASFVVVDTLVHNFLHRTGILAGFDADHPYGVGCYRPNGCADLIERMARQIDARAFNPTFPQTFPRFIQLSIWHYCSEGGRDICNGNRIDDRHPCENGHCQMHPQCDRRTLHKTHLLDVN